MAFVKNQAHAKNVFSGHLPVYSRICWSVLRNNACNKSGVSTVAELFGVHSNFFKLEVVIFYTKYKDNNYAYNQYTCIVWVVCIVVIFKLCINNNVLLILKKFGWTPISSATVPLSL